MKRSSQLALPLHAPTRSRLSGRPCLAGGNIYTLMDRWDRMGSWQLYVSSSVDCLKVRLEDGRLRALWLEFDAAGKLVKQVPSEAMKATLEGRDPEGLAAVHALDAVADRLWSMGRCGGWR